MTRHAVATVFTAVLCLLVLGAATAMAAAPKITGTTFSQVGTSSARLEAEVDPQGKATRYHFEYGTADCSSNPCVSLPDGPQISGASPSQEVSAQLEGLTPATTYHFRLIAKNSEGELKGPDISFSTYVLPQPFAACPNDEPFRTGPGALLPDCRAYEQASPVNKNGADMNGGPNEVQAASDGNAIAFFSAAGLPGGVGAQDFETYLARRGPASWSTQGVYPPASAGIVARNASWTPDLSQFFSIAAPTFNGPWTLRSRSSADGSLTTIVSPVAPDSTLAGALASSDGSKLLFQNSAVLAPGAIAGKQNLYLWNRDTGAVSLAGILPDSECGSSPPCVPAGGAFAGSYDWFGGSTAEQLNTSASSESYYLPSQHAFSTDGSKAYFTAGGTGQLYLRRGLGGPSPETVHVSASQRTTPDPLGTRPATFLGASADGSQAFFTSPEELTDDANTGPVQPAPTIARAEPDGMEPDLDFLPAHANGIAVDSEHIYWADALDGTIGRAELDGEHPEPSFITGADNPQYVAVDGEHIYWTNSADEDKPPVNGFDPPENEGNGTIGRAELTAGGADEVEQDFIEGAFHPAGIAVDSEHVYWANSGDRLGNGSEEVATRTIGRADLEGTPDSVEQAFIQVDNGTGEQRKPQGLAVNSSHIYVTGDGNDAGSFLLRYDLNGTGQLFRFDSQHPNLSGLRGVALDASHLYWARQGQDTIGRINLNLEASSTEREFITGAQQPFGLAIDGEHLYWSTNSEVDPNAGNDLYRYDAGSGQLTDLAPDHDDPNGAEVLGLLGTSEDGSYLYFAANGDLDGAGSASLGDCRGTGDLNVLSFTGACNLYVHHAGTVSFIARLDADGNNLSDAANWEPHGTFLNAPEATARVSPDGETLVFRSTRKLTAYDNEGVPEFYRYRFGEPGLLCLSCNPTGERPEGQPSSLQSIFPSLLIVLPPGSPPILTRNLSTDGNRFFFESPDKLVAEDVNGDDGCPLWVQGESEVPTCQDVYEWEAEGTGSCRSSAQNGGCLYLLSGGTGKEPAFFADASLSGEDAFLFTREPLVPQDGDALLDVYDARAGGGIAQQYPVPTVPCEGEACKGPVGTLPESPSAGSATFSGPGDPKPTKSRKGAHRKKRHHHKRHAKSRRHVHKRANHGQGGLK